MRTNYIILFILFIQVFYLTAQSQFGIMAGLNRTSINSSDLYSEPGIGYEIGLQSIGGIHHKGDLIFEMTYSLNGVNIEGDSKNANESSVLFKTLIKNLNVNFLYNYYFKLPENKKPLLALQGGISFSIFNEWLMIEDSSDYVFGSERYDSNDFVNLAPINSSFVLGIGSGIEQLRINLRYYKSLTNTLRSDYEIDMMAKNSHISLSLAYFFDKFY